MPLLVSPIDGKTPMQQLVRNGVELDRCPVSGGVWLDAGELEKLLALAQQSLEQDRDTYAEYRQSAPSQNHQIPNPRDSRRYTDDDYEHYHQKKYGRKSAMRSFFDIFD